MKLLELTLWELVALLGLAQSLWLVVFMVLRAGRIAHASLALGCFACLALAFLADFGGRFLEGFKPYPLIQDFFWLSLPLLSTLLAMQIARIGEFPPARVFLILLFAPFSALLGWGIGSLNTDCHAQSLCNILQIRQGMAITGVIGGGVALLCLWWTRSLLSSLIQEKAYRSDRYWLILALVLTNCAVLFLTLIRVSGGISEADFLLTRDILGCALVYLSSTSLFRLYPQTLKVAPKTISQFNEEEAKLLEKLQSLLTLEKVYQEPSYGRVDMARELDVSEGAVSRVVNIHFGKSVPQLLNEKRVEEACVLLIQTDAPISVIAAQVGFNSVPSFNRVFKESTGLSPSEYRAGQGKSSRKG